MTADNRAAITLAARETEDSGMATQRDRHDTRGQTLVIVAVGMIVILAMVGLVIDGGFAWSKQRDTQNAADAIAKAGTIVIQHYLADVDPVPPTDHDVACAVDATRAANGVDLVSAQYTNHEGQPLIPAVEVGPCGPTDPGIPIPLGAQGVKAAASQDFDTFLMQVVGFTDMSAAAGATAVVGSPQAVTGGALPVTIPRVGETCDEPETDFEVREDDLDGAWEPYEIIDEDDADATNMAIVPLCDTNPGSVGWLDYGCGQNLSQAVTNPCDTFIPIPAWIQTHTGDPNNLEAEFNSYTGSQVGVAEAEDSVLAMPIHDNTCVDQPADNDPTCDPLGPEWSGVGNNNFYHVPIWIGFKLDAAYIQGADLECEAGPGQPVLVDPNSGKYGCLKGWFVWLYDEPGPIGLAPIDPGDQVPLAVTLIR
jgi:hypothetical protein